MNIKKEINIKINIMLS